MTQAADSATNSSQPELKLEYAQQSSPFPTFSRWWNRSRAEVQERFDGLYKFIGVILYALGGGRQVGLAVSLSSIFGGIGLCLEHDFLTNGPRWMGLGGFLLGLVLPITRKSSLVSREVD